MVEILKSSKEKSLKDSQNLSKETVDKALEAIEIAKTTGKIKKGANEVTKAIERGTAKLVAYAKDVTPPEVIMHIPLLSKEKGILCVEVPNKEELGASAGIDVPTASVAVTEEGKAKALIKELTTKLVKPEAKADTAKTEPETSEKKDESDSSKEEPKKE